MLGPPVLSVTTAPVTPWPAGYGSHPERHQGASGAVRRREMAGHAGTGARGLPWRPRQAGVWVLSGSLRFPRAGAELGARAIPEGGRPIIRNLVRADRGYLAGGELIRIWDAWDIWDATAYSSISAHPSPPVEDHLESVSQASQASQLHPPVLSARTIDLLFRPRHFQS
jgi:hypothetical protein